MNVISKKKIDKFTKRYANAKTALESWYHEVNSNLVVWKTSSDIKKRYPSASFLEKNYVIFNIKGNKYRLVVKVAYNSGIVFIKWIGTHAEYSKKRFP